MTGKKLTRYAIRISLVAFFAAILISFASGGWGILAVIIAPIIPLLLIQELLGLFIQEPAAGISLTQSSIKIIIIIMVIVELFIAFLITRYIESKDGPMSAKDSFLSALFWLIFIGIVVPFFATPLWYFLI